VSFAYVRVERFVRFVSLESAFGRWFEPSLALARGGAP